MSLPYYKFYPGDYARDTRHLSMMQHGAYRLLIDMYMDTGKPLPNDLPFLYRWLRAESLEEKAAIEFVLTEFFELSTGKVLGWKHGRCDKELKERDEKISKATESAKKRWSSERNANAMRTHSEGNANQNQIHIKTTTARENARATPKSSGKWAVSETGTLEKAAELGLPTRAGESWEQLRFRIRQELEKSQQ